MNRVYCSVYEASVVLGITPEEIRERMKSGDLNIGEVDCSKRRAKFRIKKDLVAKAVGLDEFPEGVATTRTVRRAERAGELLREQGADTELIADVFLKHGLLTPLQAERMKGVIE